MNYRDKLKDKQRIVVKVGSSSIIHEETGDVDFVKLELLIRLLCDLRNKGKDVVLVSSGAIGVGRKILRLEQKPDTLPLKQACASVGQAALMMIYQKIFNEYHQIASQILMTKHTIVRETSCKNAKNTYNQLLDMGVIPIVNENDTVSTDEIEAVDMFGDNDTLSAVVAAIINADLLILLSDIDGLYTDDPNQNSNAKFIDCIHAVNDSLYNMAKGASGEYGTGGMVTKIDAAKIATSSDCDMIIANGGDFHNIDRIIKGKNIGTLFLANKNSDFNLIEYIEKRN